MKKIVEWIFCVAGSLGTMFFGLAIMGNIKLKIAHMRGEEVGEAMMATFFWPLPVVLAIPFVVLLIIGIKMLRQQQP